MQTINLREFYPEIYQEDYFIAVPEELAQELDSFRRSENAFRVNTYRHQAYYSLERGEGIDQDILLTVATPDELHEEKVTRQQLHAAISQLPEKQAKRIYAYYFLDMDEHEIAEAAGVSQQAIHSAIRRAMRNLEKILKKIFARCKMKLHI